LDNELEIVKEALRHSEEKLNATASVASSAETRVMQFSAFNAAIATVIGVNFRNFPVPEIALISCAVLLVVTFLAVSIVLPRLFHSCGHYWEDWKGHVDDGDALIDVLISQAEENDERIRFNEDVLERSAKKFRMCYWLQIYAVCFFFGGQIGAFFPL
jgi:hypothetical protein